MLYCEGLEKFQNGRHWQGIPSVEITKKGTLFVTFYSGGVSEQFGNFCLLYRGNEYGEMEETPVAVAYNGENSRCYDPCLWIDPLDRLWFIFSIQPEGKVYAAICDEPDAEKIVFHKPVFIGSDIMLNKPIVTKEGKWLFPIAVWVKDAWFLGEPTDTDDRRAFAYMTEDCGKTFTKLGGADADQRFFDEHMFLEKKNGDIELYMRVKYGIAKSVSKDGGKTFSYGEDSGLKNPNSRFFIGRLPSGRVLLVNHYNFNGRNNLTALLSEDDGETYPYRLLLDERDSVSYPDVGIKDGYLYVVYDRQRGATYDKSPNPAKEILLAKVTEEDIINGKLTDKGSFLKKIVNKI